MVADAQRMDTRTVVKSFMSGRSMWSCGDASSSDLWHIRDETHLLERARKLVEL